MRSVSLTVDVSDSPGVRFADVRLVATVHGPETIDPSRPPVVVFMVPGGGYSRGYFDMHFAGRDGYSQAAHHAGAGIVTVAVDPMGVGDSTTAHLCEIQFEDLAATFAACVEHVVARLREGRGTGLGAFEPAAVIGLGQSMGGCMTIVTQARHAIFDAIAVLGYSAIHTRLPQREAAQEAANAQAIAGIRRGSTGRGAANTIMQDHVYPFHFEDVPADIVSADMAGGYPIRRSSPPFGSLTIPDCAVQMMVPGVVREEAAMIAVPVFIGNGERDVCPDPRAEPAAYVRSPDIVTAVYPAMAHMHNFSTTRERLWDRLVHWYAWQARSAADRTAFA